jgi:hypothetical protein
MRNSESDERGTLSFSAVDIAKKRLYSVSRVGLSTSQHSLYPSRSDLTHARRGRKSILRLSSIEASWRHRSADVYMDDL